MSRPSKPWYRRQLDAWYVTLGGRKVSLGVGGRDNRQAAEDAWHRLMAGLPPAAGMPSPAATTPAVAEVVAGFLADAEARVKPDTLQFYRRFLHPFNDRHGTLSADRLTVGVAEAFARKPSWSSSTRNDCLGTLATCFRWAVRSGLLGRSPLDGLRLPPKESQGADAVVSRSDYERLLANTGGDFNALLRFLWATGCRPSEATALTAEAVDWANACVVLKRHKTAHRGKPRVVYLTDEAVAVLTRQRERHGGGLLFRSAVGGAFSRNALVNRLWRLNRKLGTRATAYGFRHTFATDALANGVPDAQVAELLGHSGTAMVHKHYSHLTARAKVLRQALGRVRPAE